MGGRDRSLSSFIPVPSTPNRRQESKVLVGWIGLSALWFASFPHHVAPAPRPRKERHVMRQGEHNMRTWIVVAPCGLTHPSSERRYGRGRKRSDRRSDKTPSRRKSRSCHSLLHILRDVDRSLRATEGRRRSVSDDRPRLTRFLCHLVSPLPLVTGALLPHCVRPKGPPRYARFRR